MPACLTRSLGFAALSTDSITIQDDHTSQSIISSSSLRRTRSADMSSEKWRSQTGLKKAASQENLHFDADDDDNGGPGFGFGSGSGAFEDIWSSIQREQEEKTEVEETEKPRSQTDIWSSILSQKAIDEQDANNSGANLPPPYVHPLVRRSASSLSEKSLEICTESLGSETGSDCFSPEPASDSDPEENKEEAVEAAAKEEITERQEEMVVVVKTKSAAAGGAPVRPFPPPLPSLAHRGDGSNVQMRSHRQDGRLVLEAVSVPSNNCFKAERQDGRLLLTFSGRHVSDSELADVETAENGSTEEDEEEEVCDEEEDQETDLEEEEEEGEYDDVDMVDDEVACGDGGMEESYVAAGHKFLVLTRNMAEWPRRLNTMVNTFEKSTAASALARSMPLRAHGLNPYVYSWRSKPGPGPTVVVEGKRAGKVEEDVFLKGCNLQLPKRSVLMWEPHCIAT